MEEKRGEDRRVNERRGKERRATDRWPPGTLNVALMGAGLFGQVHLNAYSLHPRANLKLVCDVNEEQTAAAREKFGCETCADYREVAADESIDAVSVATPDFLHREIVVAMLEAGKHVLVEKPLSTDLDEAREMVQAAKSAGKHMMVDFQNRWNPPFVEAKARIDAGEFGEPVMASTRLANTLFVPLQMLSWAGKSGPQWFLFPHTMDLVCWLFGRRAVRVTATGQKRVLHGMGIDAYDAVQALVEFEDCSATFETCWIIPESHPMVVDFAGTFFGTKQRISVRFGAPAMEVSGGTKFETPFLGGTQEVHGKMEGWQLMPITHFVDVLLAGDAPMVTLEDGLHNTAIICAVEQSIESGKTVEVASL